MSYFSELTAEELLKKIDYYVGTEDAKIKIEMIKNLIKVTNYDSQDHKYVTNFYTTMYNEREDFGEVAKDMIFILTLSDAFRFNYFLNDEG